MKQSVAESVNFVVKFYGNRTKIAFNFLEINSEILRIKSCNVLIIIFRKRKQLSFTVYAIQNNRYALLRVNYPATQGISGFII